MSIAQAIEFACEGFFDPTIDHPACEPKAKNIAKNYRSWARSFTHIGDFFAFLRFLENSSDTTVFASQSKLGLKTITQLVSEFEVKFKDELSDRLYPDNLKIGGVYSSYMVHAICGNYDLRSSGILPVLGEDGALDFVVIKANLSGGRYSNEWLEKNKRLKYFMKAIRGNFKETYQDNAAIINNPQIPILAFVRNKSGEDFTYCGRFSLLRIHREPDASKWFELAEWSEGLSHLPSVTSVDSTLAGQVKESLMLDPADRRRRLAAAPTHPEKYRASSFVFNRNPDVIAEVLYRANGICEACHTAAPFERLANGTPYLEVHHKIPLSKDGPDTVENAAALCPNCHRREHFGPAIWPHGI